MSTVPPVPRSPTAASCHEDGSPLAAPVGAPVVVLVGAPNVGKSTLFNALTGARRTVGNWPGTTVEVGRGGCVVAGHVADVVDLPGSYRLDPLSPDEALTRDVVLADGVERPDVVVVVASAAHLARSLYLVAQVRETDLPVVVALTMGDVAARRGIRVDADALAAAIGCPVVALDPRRRSGVDGLVAAVGASLDVAVARPRTTGPGDPGRRARRGRRTVRLDRRGRHGIREHPGDEPAHLVGPHRPLRHGSGDRSAALPRCHVGGLPGDDHARGAAAGRPGRPSCRGRCRRWARWLVDTVGLGGSWCAGWWSTG